MNMVRQICRAVRPLYGKLREKDRGLEGRAYFYMCTYAVESLVLVLFPKLLLDMCLHNAHISVIVVGVAVLLCIGGVSGWLNRVIREDAKARIGYLRIDYLADAFYKIITSDYHYMEDSSFFNRYESSFDACSSTESGIEKMYNLLFELPAYGLRMLVITGIVWIFSPLAVMATAIHVFIIFEIKKKIAVYKFKLKEEVSKVSRKRRYYSRITQDFQYGKDIRLYQLRPILGKKFTEEIRKDKNIHKKIKNREWILQIIPSITGIINFSIIYGVLIVQKNINFSIADITMYFLATNMLVQAIEDVGINLSGIYGESLYIADYFSFIRANLGGEQGREKYIWQEDTLSVELNNLSFKYPGTDKYIIKNLSLKIEPGEKIALVGDNGIGKSTLVKVLTGLFREYEGEIIIGGKEIRHVDNLSLFSIFAVVFQDINLLAFSVKENITGNREAADENRIWDIIQKVGLDKKISNYNNGLNQQVHKYIDETGIEFSGGESQKMVIARAIYSTGKIFILDEPTSALDALAEKEIYEKFNQITEKKTTIFISHRLASTKFCDRVVLLGEGGILEQGSHEELMLLQGKYYDMFIQQGKYYQEDIDEKTKAID